MISLFVSRQKFALYGLGTILLLLLVLPQLVFFVVRIGSAAPIDYNEGWNVIHTNRLLAGLPLYLPLFDLPLTPVNYPPLSFVLIGTFSYLTGSILFAGRLVSLLSFLLVACLIYGIVFNLCSKRSIASFAALFWAALSLHMAGHYVGMHDPQMLGHVFSLGSLYLYSKWMDELDARKIWMLGILCCLALAIKHLLIAVPITLAVTLCLTHRRAFYTFAFAGTCLSLVIVIGSWIYGGDDLLANFLELDRQVSVERMSRKLFKLLYGQHLWVLFLPLVLLLVGRVPSRWRFILTYFSLSFVLGGYASRGVGVDVNAWFDFLIAAAIVLGMCVARSHGAPIMLQPSSGPMSGDHHHVPRSVIGSVWRNPIVTYGIVALCVLPFFRNYETTLATVLNYEKLRQQDMTYKNEVLLLRSIMGPVLGEGLLLGFEAGKEFLVDPFNLTQLIRSGRVPEKILVDPIRSKYFGAVILDFDINKKLAERHRETNDHSEFVLISSERWTGDTLKAINDNYELLDYEGPRLHFIYVPRGHG